MADVRRWLVQPARGQRRLGAGDSFFGSFVSIFVNPRIEDSERQVRFVSQPFALPAPLPPPPPDCRRHAPAGAHGCGAGRGERQNHEAAALPGRFEWKILAALFIVASLPLGAAAYLMSVTIGRIQAVTEQHQEAVRQALGGAVEVYRSYFAQMKENFRDRGNEIAAARITRASELADVPGSAARAHPRGQPGRRRMGAAGGGAGAGARGATDASSPLGRHPALAASRASRS